MPRHRMHGFTIIELLTSIAVIAVMISLLLPGISRARNQAKTAKCTSNMRQMALGFNMYASDWNDVVMPIGDWNTDNPDPNKVAPYWYERCTDYLKFAKNSQGSTVDILRCPIGVEQLAPINHIAGQSQVKYGLNFNICKRGVPFRKFGSLQRLVILASDGCADQNTKGEWGVYEGVNKDWKPWPIAYPGMPGHNNSHLANLLFSDYHIELRGKNPTDLEWKDN